MKSSEQIRVYAGKLYVEPVRHGTGTTVSIRAGDIVKGLGLKNKTPNVCSALRSKIFQEQYGVQLIGEQGPPSGMSTTVVFTYKVLKQTQTKVSHSPAQSASPSAFNLLRGIGKKTFKKLGGGEAFIRGERENFYRPSPGKRG